MIEVFVSMRIILADKVFASQYGAIKDIDFTPIFEEILAREGEV